MDSSAVDSFESVWVSIDVLVLSGVFTPDGLTGVDIDSSYDFDYFFDPHTFFPEVVFGKFVFPIPFPFLIIGSCSRIGSRDLLAGASRSDSDSMAMERKPSLHPNSLSTSSPLEPWTTLIKSNNPCLIGGE